jgi:hypothetical protein
MTLQARLSEIDEADVRAYCTGEKPVARVVILALERVVEYARNGDHEKMGCITQSRRKVRRPPAYRSSPGRE